MLLRLEEERFAEKQVQKVTIEDGGKGHHEVQLDAPLKLCSLECKAIIFYLAELESP